MAHEPAKKFNFFLSVASVEYSDTKTGVKLSFLTHVCKWFDLKTLCYMSLVCKKFRIISSDESLWKPVCLSKWSELQHATSLLNDPFPIWKSCFSRKISEESTSMQDLMKEFGNCDWYSCSNGHLYVIGECRLPVQMAKCPECGEKIGGRYHRMLDSNSRLGAVNATYNPFRHYGGGYGNNNDSQSIEDTMADKIDFSQVANVLTKQRKRILKSINENNNNDDDSSDDNNGNNATNIDLFGSDNDNDDIEMKHNNNDDNNDNDTNNKQKQNNEVGLISERAAIDFEKYLSKLEDTSEAPEYLVCPLNMSVFEDPVVTPNGAIYEKNMILEWLHDNDCDPIDQTVKLSKNDLKPELQIKNACDIWRKFKANQDLNAKLSQNRKDKKT